MMLMFVFITVIIQNRAHNGPVSGSVPAHNTGSSILEHFLFLRRSTHVAVQEKRTTVFSGRVQSHV